MSDEDDAMNSALDELDADANDARGSSDDESSSSSSGSSSSSSDSDSDSDKEGDDDNSKKPADRKNSFETTPTFGPSNGLSSRTSDAKDRALAEPLNVNSTRAAARFREQVGTEPGMMALGTKKRDRRTIEMIQRDLQSKRGKTAISSNEKKPSVVVKRNIVRPMASPPKTSPVMSPDSGTEMERIHLGMSKNTATQLKSNNSARSRLEKKLLGRPTSRPASSATKSQPAKKPGTGASTSTATLTITPMTATGSSNRSVISGGSSGSEHDSPVFEPHAEATTAQHPLQPSGRVIRSVLRVLLRYGDLTDVHLFPSQDHYKSFADDYKLPNFIIRSNLHTQCKLSEDQLLKLACEIGEMAHRAIEERKDSMKYMEVEIKPSQVIERLYENLKLRVAVQQALHDAGISTSRKGATGVYSLVAKHQDVTVLGIRDIQAWTWAEKEHDWNGRKDTALLLGVYLHGFGAWEEILNDDQLSLKKQRALKGERLKKRAENLLKRLPAPTSAEEPSFVTMASTLGGGGQDPAQSLGAQISAIANGASVKGGRMQRTADRAAAARQDSSSTSSRRPTDDSIRKDGDQPSSSIRKSSIASPPRVPITVAANVVGAVTPTTADKAKSKHSSTKRPSSNEREESERKRKHSKSSKSKKRRKLSLEEIMDKWNPAKQLKEIRQVLKKMNAMADWSKQQNDEVVVEKVYQYTTTIGETIDKIIQQTVQEKIETMTWTSSQWDELCTALWTYAAGFTSFQPLVFERLYDDICVDGERLRLEQGQGHSVKSS